MRMRAFDPNAIPPKIGEALAALAILQRWEKAIGAGLKPERAARRVLGHLKAQGKPISRATLHGWRKAYRRQGVAGLIDGRRGYRDEAVSEAVLRRRITKRAARIRGDGLIVLAIIAASLAARREYQTDKARAKGGRFNGPSNGC